MIISQTSIIRCFSVFACLLPPGLVVGSAGVGEVGPGSEEVQLVHTVLIHDKRRRERGGGEGRERRERERGGGGGVRQGVKASAGGGLICRERGQQGARVDGPSGAVVVGRR